MEVANELSLLNLKNHPSPESRFLDSLKNGEEMRTITIEKERYLIEELIAEGTLTDDGKNHRDRKISGKNL